MIRPHSSVMDLRGCPEKLKEARKLQAWHTRHKRLGLCSVQNYRQQGTAGMTNKAQKMRPVRGMELQAGSGFKAAKAGERPNVGATKPCARTHVRACLTKCFSFSLSKAPVTQRMPHPRPSARPYPHYNLETVSSRKECLLREKDNNLISTPCVHPRKEDALAEGCASPPPDSLQKQTRVEGAKATYQHTYTHFDALELTKLWLKSAVMPCSKRPSATERRNSAREHSGGTSANDMISRQHAEHQQS
eukprot:656497-Pelagomonas_calceolata.AAC.2